MLEFIVGIIFFVIVFLIFYITPFAISKFNPLLDNTRFEDMLKLPNDHFIRLAYGFMFWGLIISFFAYMELVGTIVLMEV